jgi:hypothetical protein
MKKTLLNIHIYVGLVFGPYFAIYGLSTLAFNHGWGWQNPSRISVEKTLDLPSGLEGADLAWAVRDSLGSWGSIPGKPQPDEAGIMNYRVRRPAREYRVRLKTGTGEAALSGEDYGFWGVVKGLHGLRGVDGSAWANTWWVYSEVSIWALAFAALGGVYFWWDRVAERRIGWWILGVGTACSALMMLYMAT